MKVVGGFLCPSSEWYVKGKNHETAISLAKRVHLCDLACADSNWISTNDWGEASAGSICQSTLQILKGTLTFANNIELSVFYANFSYQCSDGRLNVTGNLIIGSNAAFLASSSVSGSGMFCLPL